MAANPRLLDILCRAVSRAAEDAAFFSRAAAECAAGRGRTVFRHLAERQKAREEELRAALSGLEGGKGLGEACGWVVDERPAGPEVLAPSPGQADEPGGPACAEELSALEEGLARKRAALTYLEEQLAEARGPEEKSLWDRLLQEERGLFMVLDGLRFFHEGRPG